MHDQFFSEVAANMGIEAIRTTINVGKTNASKIINAMKLNFTRELPLYQRNRYEKLKEIPSLFLNGDTIDVLTNFHEMNLLSPSGQPCHENELMDLCEKGSSFAVEAQGGYGKSFLLRWLYLNISNNNDRNYFPIFIELRDINNIEFETIYDLLQHETGLEGEAGLATLKYGLSNGYFIIFFDAFDEIRLVNRERFLSGITTIRSSHPKTPLVVSGRQNDYFPIWGRLPVYKILPLSLSHVRSLILTAPGLLAKKEAFVERLTPSFYKKYESFLSNPLLALLMLLVFSSSGAQLPSRQSEFFERAYVALCIGLDSIKTFRNDSAYRRIFQSNLRYPDFAKIFSVFSAISYVKGKLHFDEIEIEVVMSESIKKSNVNLEDGPLKVREVVADFYESICLFRRDGRDFVYTHKSFQEYFAAKFFAESTNDKLVNFLSSNKFRINDDVITMIFEMNQEKVFFEWVAPAIENLLILNDSKNPIGEEFLLSCWDEVILSLDDSREIFFHYGANSRGRMLLTLARLFPDEFNDYDAAYRSPTRRKFVEIQSRSTLDALMSTDKRFQLAYDDLERERKDGKSFMVRRIPLIESDLPALREAGLTRASGDDYNALLRIKERCDQAIANYRELDDDLF